MRSRHSASRGSTAAPPARGRCGPSAVGPAERVPRPVDGRRRARANGGVTQREGRGRRTAAARRTSPMPRTRARPPTRQNGTSAPSAAATARSSQPGPAQHGGGVGRAAAEPAAGGDALVDVHVRRCGRRRAAPGARGCRRRRHAGGDRPVDRRARRRRSIVERVGQVERDHLGVDQVVAVGAHAGDPQRQGQLGRAPARRPVGHRRRASPARGQRAPVVDVELLGPGLGRDAGGLEALRASTSPASERRSILRRWPNPARTSANSASAVGRRRRGTARRAMSTSADSTFGRGRNTPAGTWPTTAAVAQYATFTRHDAVGLGRRPRPPAARPPRAAPSPASARSPARRRAGRRTSGVATLYGRLATSTQRGAAAEQRVQSSAHGVGLDDVHAGVGSTASRSTGSEAAVDLDRGDRGARLGQGQGQRAEAGADLDDVVAGPDAGQPGDAAHRVGVDDEVLPEGAARARGRARSSSAADVGAVSASPADADGITPAIGRRARSNTPCRARRSGRGTMARSATRAAWSTGRCSGRSR